MQRFLDEFLLAFQGLALALRKKTFFLTFLFLFFAFALLLNLLSSGLSGFKLMFSSFPAFCSVVSSVFLAIFGVGKTFPDWLLNFLLALLQTTLISLIIFLAKANHAQAQAGKTSPTAVQSSQKSTFNSSALESSALVTGLAVLGSGCPTCGTTLLAPVLGTLLSGASGSLAVATQISLVLNLLALLLGFLIFRKLGFITYATIKSEEYALKHQKSQSKTSSLQSKSQKLQPKSSKNHKTHTKDLK